ncbi:hypothetical protein D3C81_359220 [compost metagenome]
MAEREIVVDYSTLHRWVIPARCRYWIRRFAGINVPVVVNATEPDGAPYHRTSRVQHWAFVMNIELHYLPPYSPNLNPIARLWKVMNEHARNNRYFPTAKAFSAAISGFFDCTLPAIAGELTRRINDNFQILKPASSFPLLCIQHVIVPALVF